VFGGMASATLLGVLFVPLFFVVVMRLFRERAEPAPRPAQSAAPAPSPLAPH
jgi:hypothetical protein